MMNERTTSFGQETRLTWVDRFGIHLSARRIRRFVRDFKGKRLVDIGCGYRASFYQQVRGEVTEAWLIDVALAPELRESGSLHPLEGDLVAGMRRIDAGSIDVVLCISVLEHLWHPEEALAEMVRIMAPGGVCLLNVPTWLGKQALEFSAFRLGLSPACEMDDHKMYYAKRDLWPLLIRAGFKPSGVRLTYHKFGLNLFAACKRS